LILNGSGYFKGLFHNTSPEYMIVTNNGINNHCNLYKINTPIPPEIFKLAIDMLYDIFLGDQINKIDADDYLDLLKAYDYLLFDETHLTSLFTTCIENLEKISDLNKFFEVVIDLNILDKSYKNFFYGLFYHKHQTLRELFGKNDIKKNDNFLHETTGFDPSTNTLILSSDLLRTKLLGMSGKYIHGDYTYVISTTYSYPVDEYGYWIQIYPSGEKTININKEELDEAQILEMIDHDKKIKCRISIVFYNLSTCTINEKLLCKSEDNLMFFDSEHVNKSDVFYPEEMDDTEETEVEYHLIPNILEYEFLTNKYTRSRYGIITNCKPDSAKFEIRINFID